LGVPEWLSFVAPSLVDSVFALTVSGTWRTVVTQEWRRFITELNPDLSFILPFSGDGVISKCKKLIFLRLAGVTKNVYGWKIHATAGLLRRTQFRLGLFDHQVIAPLKALQEYIPELGIQRDGIKFALAIPEDAENFANKIWQDRSWSTKMVIAICPGGAFTHKRWPAENYVTLCEKIKEYRNADFVILGGKGDCQVGNELSSVLGNRALDLTGRTTILQTAAILKKCNLFIGNDSGPAHLASAIGCPTVTVMYSVVFPGIWEPWNDINSAIRHSVSCEHCFSYLGCPAGTQECIRGIAVATVLDRCKRLLARES
jgi:ADP-heptose:LPS heptosyltransferase